MTGILYRYVGNRPIIDADPSGLQWGMGGQGPAQFCIPDCGGGGDGDGDRNDCYDRCDNKWGKQILAASGLGLFFGPILPKRMIGLPAVGASKSTSPGSLLLRKCLPFKLPGGRWWAPTLRNPGSYQNTVGGFLSRWLSWYMIAESIYLMNAYEACIDDCKGGVSWTSPNIGYATPPF